MSTDWRISLITIADTIITSFVTFKMTHRNAKSDQLDELLKRIKKLEKKVKKGK
jgi:hypothetical protein